MGFLDNVQSGKRIRPRRIMLYGTPGIGKSTFASLAPRPIFVKTEDNIDDIECDSIPKDRKVESFEEYIACLGELFTQPHEYKTIVTDTADALERLIWADVCRLRNVKDIREIKFQDGYTFALNQWQEVLTGLDALRNDRGMNVILLAHADVEKVRHPETETYDHFTPRLHKLASNIVRDWCEEVLFATARIYTVSTDEGFSKTRVRGVSTDDRVLRTSERPSHVAKNHLPGLPYEIPLDWNEYAKHWPGATAA